jgi:hypothetical protein
MEYTFNLTPSTRRNLPRYLQSAFISKCLIARLSPFSISSIPGRNFYFRRMLESLNEWTSASTPRFQPGPAISSEDPDGLLSFEPSYSRS